MTSTSLAYPPAEWIDEPAASHVPTLAPTVARDNLGQAANTVHGGMHLHRQTITNVYQQAARARPTPRGRAYLATVAATFVAREYRSDAGACLDRVGAGELLAAAGSLVLLGEPGTGRHTAAVGVLATLDLPIQEIPIEPYGTQWLSVTELPTESAHGYLLELPDSGGRTLGDSFARDLQSYREELATHSSYLVVVASPETWRMIGGQRDKTVLSVQPPDPLALLATEVSRLNPDSAARAVGRHATVTALVTAAPPREVARLAELVVATSQDADRSTAALAQEVADAFSHWYRQLTEWFRDHPDQRSRLFLVATAFLAGCHGQLILHLGEFIGRALATRAEWDGLGGNGLHALASAAGARIDTAGRVSLPKPGYGPAVLDFVRTDRTKVCAYRTWRAAIEFPLELPAVARAEVAAPIAGSLLHGLYQDRHERLLHLVIGEWSGNDQLRPTLVQLLTTAGLSREVGRTTRSLLYELARSNRPLPVHQAVIEVCQGDLADAYPEIALTRLGHLAGRDDPATRERVAAAVAQLWRRPPLRRPVLRRLCRWLTTGDEPAAATAATALARIGESPEPAGCPLVVAAADRPDWHALVTAITTTLDRPGTTADLADAAFAWLELAISDGACWRAVAALWREAAQGTTAAPRTARLYTLVLRWHASTDPGTPAAQRATRDRLRERLLTTLRLTDRLPNAGPDDKEGGIDDAEYVATVVA
ncbi:hypothetical protein JQS43_09620 [Natronosporangium hydrolyticum]|uniref:Uncharacterized protein n=1 Tax=Natronosporangium hydrolyticum TaxID=2811111 RepID=A0A895YF66_9ACTN|nr:hypothetical protein [Natronosporangium hydrolyticum]QSB16504.1 hypothetical protein JQS43_09620 [Natronosporangium hydrolyticum]